MISDVFYLHNIKLSNKIYQFEDSYLFYFVSRKMKNYGMTSEHQIIEWIKEFYNLDNINKTRLNSFLSKFMVHGDSYYLDNLTSDVLDKVDKFEEDFFSIYKNNKKYIYKKLSSYIGKLPFEIEEALPYMFALDKLENDRSLDYYSYLYFSSLTHKKQNYKIMNGCVSTLDPTYRICTVDLFFKDKVVLNVMFANEINTLNDLLSLSIESLLLIFSLNLDEVTSLFMELSENFSFAFVRKIKEKANTLKEREKGVIALRNGFNNQPRMTLEEIAKKYDLTRERIRQIELSAMKKLTVDSDKLDYLFACLYYTLAKDNEKYFLKDRVFECLKNNILSDYILLFMSLSEAYIRYDSRLGIVYNAKLTSLKEIEDGFIAKYKDYIKVSDYKELNDFEKIVVDDNYRLVDNVIYIKRGVNESNLYRALIDDIFPNGYHISDMDSYEKFKDEFKKRYEYWNENMTPRLVSTYLNRGLYCQIDRGTYKNKDYVVKLSQDLIDRIINYILENKPTIYYQSIYEHFKDELESIGVNNYYYLKGLIDEELPKDFKTKRDYIQVGDIKITSKENLLMFMKSFDSSFSFEDLRAKFKGIKDYVFFNSIYKEKDNGLIWLSSKNFIYIDKANIKEETIKELKSFIDDSFTSLNSKVLSSRKIYSRLLLKNKPLLEDLNIVTDQFSLFSLIQYLYKYSYYFRRPLISYDGMEQLHQEDAIKEYVMKLDSFNLKIIKEYKSKLDLLGINSYTDFMEDMSDEFVQVNIDTMVKKKLMNIDDKFLNKFENLFNLVFSKVDEVNTKTFNGYNLLPNLSNYTWNKYLLVGIIRTYFSDKYDIENTDRHFDITDFIIRKIG